MTWGPERIQAEIDRIKAAEKAGPTFVAHTQFLSLHVSHFPAGVPQLDERVRTGGRLRDAHNRPVFLAFLKALEAMNFWTALDRSVHPLIRSGFAMGAHRTSRLRFRAHYYPTGLKLEFYPDGNTDNPNGPQYATSDRKRHAMGPREWLAFKAATRKLAAVAAGFGAVDCTEPTFDDPRDLVEWRCRTSGHFKGEASIDVPRATQSYNDRDRNKKKLVNGDLKCFRHWDGRLWCGRAYANLNNMWWVVCGGEVRNMASFELWDFDPKEPRKAPTRSVIDRAKRHLASAVKAENFERAIPLRDHIKALEAGAAR